MSGESPLTILQERVNTLEEQLIAQAHLTVRQGELIDRLANMLHMLICDDEDVPPEPPTKPNLTLV